MNTDPKITELETITVPEWIPNGDELTIEGVHALSMADVILVSNPIEKMGQYGDSILDYLDTYDLDRGENWQSYCAKIIQRAIEAWAEMTAEEVPDLDADLEYIKTAWEEMQEYLDPVAKRNNDEIALNESFNNWTAGLCDDGVISYYTYRNITREDVENA